MSHHNDRPTDKHIIFAHGMESGPWGAKIIAMAHTARELGWSCESIDYAGEYDARVRVQTLVNHKPQAKKLVLIGSSMGGYVSTMASQHIPNVSGLFLLAPAFYMARSGYVSEAEQAPTPYAHATHIMHGWNDEVIPPQHSIRFAQEHHAHLELVNDDHRLIESIPHIQHSLAYFLNPF